MNDLIQRLEMWCDATSKCIWCDELEPNCCCTQGHTPQDWTPTPESKAFLEAAEAIKKLYGFALKCCPKCDDCEVLLLEGGIVESDGLHGKPARIVCPICRAKNPHACDPESVEPSRAELSMREWTISEADEAALKTMGVLAAMRQSISDFRDGRAQPLDEVIAELQNETTDKTNHCDEKQG